MRTTDLKELKSEQSIVWVDAAAKDLPYVREDDLKTPSRMRAPRMDRERRAYLPSSTMRLVAYATLQPRAHGEGRGSFLRRIWWVKAQDPYQEGGALCEAVDPRSIAPRQLSQPPK